MTPPPWTIQRVLAWTSRDLAGRGFETARLDSELLVAHALGCRRLDLYLRHEEPLADAELSRVRGLIERRRSYEPVAYILGEREFYGRMFLVDTRVLIPRPETEELVDALVECLPSDARRLLDVGVGSGAISVTLAAMRPELTIDAVELSPAAADVARANIARYGFSNRIHIHIGSLYDPVPGRTYDAVVSNPPYIPTALVAGLMPDVSVHEPRMALDGGPDGAMILRPLVHGARAALTPGGWLAAEIGHDQGPLARSIALEAGLSDVEIRKDLARIDRILRARAPG